MTNTGVESRAPGWVPDLSTLGARLALIRQAMGWNIAEAAVECGVPVASWRNWENRGKEPRGLINVAMKIAGVTGVDYRWIALGPAETQASPLPEAARLTHGYSSVKLGAHVVTTVKDLSYPATRTDTRTIRTSPIGR